MYAQVIVNIKTRELDQTYTYSLPPDSDYRAVVGARVVVPFGKSQYVDGVIIAIDSVKPDYRLKPIHQVLAPIYHLTASQLTLMKHLKKHYGATYQEAFLTVLPSVQKLDKKIMYHINDTLQPYKKGQHVTAKELQAHYDSARIKDLIKAKKIAKRPLFTIVTEAKKSTWVHANFSDLNSALSSIGKRAVKQQRILRHIAHIETILLTELTKATQSSKRDIDKLCQAGLLSQSTQLEGFDSGRYNIAEQAKVVPPLTPEQAGVTDQYQQLSEPRLTLLQGVTGSGKTRVYIEIAKRIIARGGQVLVLVPEISLTPQLVQRFASQLTPHIGVIHTHVNPTHKASIYRQIAKGDIQVVIGARSALFAPYHNLQSIIIDEEHESSYKSDTIPRFHTVTLAYLLAKELKIDLMLGSATPAATTLYMVEQGQLQLLQLTSRIGRAGMSTIQLVDLKGIDINRSWLSDTLYQALSETFDKGEQAVLFHNRKGFANYSQCHYCGYIHQCRNCEVPLSIHDAGKTLQCHYCGYRQGHQLNCPTCQQPMVDTGIGIEQVLEQLEQLFPKRRFARIDADITRSHKTFIELLNDFSVGKIDALIGTQIIAKGLDFPDVTLVGVINADQLLNMPDYAAAERAYQLLTQVAGRAGRHQKTGRVLIQTYQPNHPMFDYMIRADQQGFIKEEMRQRALLHYPPYGQLLTLKISSEDKRIVQRQAEGLYSFYSHNFKAHGIKAMVYPPVTPFYAKIKHRYFMLITIKVKPQSYSTVLKALYLGIVKNKYQLMQERCWVDIDFER